MSGSILCVLEVCLKDIGVKVFAPGASSAMTGKLSSFTDRTKVYSVRGNSWSQLHQDWWSPRHNGTHWFALRKVKFTEDWYSRSNPYWLLWQNTVGWLHKEWWCNFINSISQDILASSTYFWAYTNRIFFTTFIFFSFVSLLSPSPLCSSTGSFDATVGRECVLVGTRCSQEQTWVESRQALNLRN